MAYQNPGAPRFYIDVFQYLKNLGFELRFNDDSYSNLINLDPAIATEITTAAVIVTWSDAFIDEDSTNAQNQEDNILFEMKNFINPEKTYYALLNHNITPNFSTATGFVSNPNIPNDTFENREEILNAKDYSESNVNAYLDCQKGCTIMVGDTTSWTVGEGVSSYNKARLNATDVSENLSIGAFSMGSYYDMPHSPELDLTMTIENDGYDFVTTQGGSHLSNVKYTGAPMWERTDGTKVPPWTIGEPTAVGRRHGRRVWDLQFNYLNDSDLFASNYMNTNYMESGSDTGYDSGDIENNDFYYTLESDDSFHAQVLNKVGNGQRFIFQPDNTNNNPDQFAICQLDQDSLDISQVANGVYNIKLKIREVW
tara:strand:+ start:2816 stop:3919 length:1104 start_codon:yes stop_codon:yes gene_type:complete